MTTDINLPFISSDSAGPKHLHHSLPRAKLEQLATPIVEKIKTYESALEGLSHDELRAKTNEFKDKIAAIGFFIS